MHHANGSDLRRSSRVPAAVPILVTSLEGTQFSEVCETLVVNAHGFAVLTRVKLDAGVPLHLHSKDGRETTARVVSCEPVGAEAQGWRLGAKLDRPQNFWGLKDCPKDWAVPSIIVQPRVPQAVAAQGPLSPHKILPGQLSPDALDRVARQMETQVAKMIWEAVRPLQGELTTIKEKLARKESNPSRFEVSLSSIPPELQQQLELRLRNELGPKVLDEARQQAGQLLTSAKTAIDQRTSEGHKQFLQRVAEELKAVEKRAQDLSAHIGQNVREHTRRGLEDFQQKLVEGGNSLKRLSEELLAYVQQTLDHEQEARRRALDELRVSLDRESARLRDEIENLQNRIGKLDTATEALETGLDQRLSQLSSNIVRDARKQLEAAGGEALEDLTVRAVATLGTKLDETAVNIRTLQAEIVASASESLKEQGTAGLQTFKDAIEVMATRSVEGWRIKLASTLYNVAKCLGEQLQVQESATRQTE